MDNTQPLPTPPAPLTAWGRVLFVLFVVNGLSAVAGSIGVMRGLMPFPDVWLHGTPFHGYFVPGLILCVVVGGSHLAAAYILSRSLRFAKIASRIAGLILIGWMIGEFKVIGFQAPIQVWFVTLGLLEVGLSFTRLHRT